VADGEQVRIVAREVNESEGWVAQVLTLACLLVGSNLAGQVADAISWYPVDLFALYWFAKEKAKGKPLWKKACCDRCTEREWHAAAERYDRIVRQRGTAMVEKSHVESRAFFNMAALSTVLVLLGFIYWSWPGDGRSLAAANLSGHAWALVWSVIVLTIPVFVLFSLFRQRRRVLGVLAGVAGDDRVSGKDAGQVPHHGNS
jgi:hypothetical protein